MGFSFGVGSTKVPAPTDHWETRNVKHAGVSVQKKVFNLLSHPEGWELKVINSLGDLCYLKGQDRLDDPYTIYIARASPKLPQPRLKMTDSQNGLCAIRTTKIMETLFYSRNPSSWKK